MRAHKIRSTICAGSIRGVRFPRCITASAFLLLLHCLAIPCVATELKQETVEAFDRYIRVTDARVDAELCTGGPFLWVNSLPQPRRQRLYDLLQRGEPEIRQERTQEEGKPTVIPDGLIHHWTGVAFAPGVSLERALSLLQDYDNQWRTYKPDVRRSKLLEHTDDSFKIYRSFTRTPHAAFPSTPNSKFITPGSQVASALIFVVSAIALLQFFISYCRSLGYR